MSRILAEVHETAKDLHEAGIFSDEQQTKFDLLDRYSTVFQCTPEDTSVSVDQRGDLAVEIPV